VLSVLETEDEDEGEDDADADDFGAMSLPAGTPRLGKALVAASGDEARSKLPGFWTSDVSKVAAL